MSHQEASSHPSAVLTGWILMLGLGCLVAAVVGVVRGQLALALFGLAMSAFFGPIAWLVRPTTVDVETARRRYNRQNAVFKRLRIRWLIGPDWNEDEHRS